jgi:hypothetical protein
MEKQRNVEEIQMKENVNWRMKQYKKEKAQKKNDPFEEKIAQKM